MRLTEPGWWNGTGSRARGGATRSASALVGAMI